MNKHIFLSATVLILLTSCRKGPYTCSCKGSNNEEVEIMAIDIAKMKDAKKYCKNRPAYNVNLRDCKVK